MAYCRMITDNSIYMYPSVYGGILCTNCNIYFTSRTEAKEHLLKHREDGKDIPDYAILRLEDEIERLGDTV